MVTKPASSFSLEQLAACFNSAFQDYVGTAVNFTADSLGRYMKDSLYSLENSLVMADEETGEAIAFAFIATREDLSTVSRLAAFGVAASWKGKGLGAKLLELIKEAEKARGIKIIELECIKQNTPALGLYRGRGFTILRELPGWERDVVKAGEFPVNEELQDVALPEVRALVRQWGVADLTWQAWAVDNAMGVCHCYKLGQAYCVVALPEKIEDAIKVRSLIVDPNARQQGEARRLAAAVLAKYPERKWMVPALFPGEYVDKLANEFGFVQSKLSQVQMRVQLIE